MGVAIGDGAECNQNHPYYSDYSVALGSGSKTRSAENVWESNVVSVGDYGSFKRRLINLSAGINPNDAVIKSQLDAVGGNTVYTTTGGSSAFTIDLGNSVSSVTNNMIINVIFNVSPNDNATLTIANPTLVASDIVIGQGGGATTNIKINVLVPGTIYRLQKHPSGRWLVLDTMLPIDELTNTSMASPLSARMGSVLANKRSLNTTALTTLVGLAADTLDSQWMGYQVNLAGNLTFGTAGATNIAANTSFGSANWAVGHELTFLIAAGAAARTITIPAGTSYLTEGGTRTFSITANRVVEMSVIKLTSTSFRFVFSGEFY